MQANQLHKQRLEEFWFQFDGWKARGRYDQFPAFVKLSKLIEMAAVVIPFRRQQSNAERRKIFNEVKATLCRQKLGTPCFVCSKPGFSRHHIIQLQNGGLNSRRNLVVLCDDCHSAIHPWMKVA
jgi:hypothetical protein